MKSELKQKSMVAAVWSVTGQLAQTLLTFVIFAILARPLGPEEYGLLGMVMVITSFARVFTDSGFNKALIQAADPQERHFSSVFWFNVVVGFLLTALFFLGSPWVAEFYERPQVAPVCRLISFSFLIYAMHLVQMSLMIRELEFQRISICGIFAQLIAGVVAIVLAFSGYGVWSIAIQAILVPSFLTIFLWYASDWRPRLLVDLSALSELLNFSGNLLGTSVLNYWTCNLDKLLIGKFLGETLLGFYNRAYSVMMLPITNISNSLSRVLFPSLSQIQQDKNTVKRVFLKVTRVVGCLTYPATLGLAAVAPQFIEVVLGSKWLPMTNVLRILCLVSMIQSTSSLIGNLYLSQGRADIQFRVSWFLRIIPVIGIVIGLRWGIEGVAAGYLVGVMLNQFPNLYYGGGLVDLGLGQYFRQVFPNAMCAAAMAIFVWGISVLLHGNIPVWVALVIEIFCGILTYYVLLRGLNLRSFHESIQIAQQYMPRLGYLAGNGPG